MGTLGDALGDHVLLSVFCTSVLGKVPPPWGIHQGVRFSSPCTPQPRDSEDTHTVTLGTPHLCVAPSLCEALGPPCNPCYIYQDMEVE